MVVPLLNVGGASFSYHVGDLLMQEGVHTLGVLVGVLRTVFYVAALQCDAFGQSLEVP